VVLVHLSAPYILLRKIALGAGCVVFLAAIAHAGLWMFFYEGYLPWLERLLSWDEDFERPGIAMAWCLVALVVLGAAGLYMGRRALDIFNLPERWGIWQTGFLVWFAAWALAPFVFQLRIWEDEDGILEWLTFWNVGIAGLIVLFVALKNRSVMFGIAALALCFYAGEEISWGQRVFGLVTPDWLIESNHQQETNLHNLIPVLSIGYLIFFTIIALFVSENRYFLKLMKERNLVSSAEGDLLTHGLDLPLLAILLFITGFIGGYSNELAEVLFASITIAIALRLALPEPITTSPSN
jgi:hypothetical protein